MPEANDPRHDPGAAGIPDQIRETLLVVDRKRECLNILGVTSSSIEHRIDESRKIIEDGSPEEARKSLDEILVFFSILAEEIASILSKLDRHPGRKGTPEPESSQTLSIEEIELTVEEAFLKHLHSSGLRRMVEVICLEKIRSVLGDEEFYQKVVKKGVERALAERSKEPAAPAPRPE